jgi:hypothetical protein
MREEKILALSLPEMACWMLIHNEVPISLCVSCIASTQMRSFVLSPNDVSSCHHDVKTETSAQSNMQMKAKSDAEMEASVAKFVNDVLRNGVGKNIDAARKRSMIAYASYALDIYSKAFSKAILKKGWEVPGYVPYNPRRILSKWTGWRFLTPKQGTEVLEALPEFAAYIHGPDGRCDDAVISAKLPFLNPCTNSVELGGVPRDRCVKINAVGYEAARAAAAPEKAAKAAENAEKARKRGEKYPKTIYTWQEDVCGFFPKDAVVIQLNLRKEMDRNLQWKASDPVDLLRQKWRDFDSTMASASAMSNRSASDSRIAQTAARVASPDDAPECATVSKRKRKATPSNHTRLGGKSKRSLDWSDAIEYAIDVEDDREFTEAEERDLAFQQSLYEQHVEECEWRERNMQLFIEQGTNGMAAVPHQDVANAASQRTYNGLKLPDGWDVDGLLSAQNKCSFKK